ncbi:DUF2863 family protein [Undibacterium terreum]|uniref:DUF2863 family protein n=1 Tax=Undibacterium terreum TaxID=1224302 RepID=A0A916UWZ2_9BURK|nr:DUF2863 family protein [Undibacterium terreum]GGC90859.1 hypothetical protein GCM10011396_42650 [Undibacterium terreum]
MRRPPKKNRIKLAADSVRIANLAQAVAQSGSRLEDLSWQEQLDLLVAKTLKSHHQDLLDAASEHLFETHPNSYEVLMETMESLSTSCRLEYEHKFYDAMLIAAPVLAWTRFDIPSGPIPGESVTLISAHMASHILADHAQLQILPTLYSIDQLPRSHSDTFALTEQLALSLLKGAVLKPQHELPQTIPFLADIRYLLAVVVTPVLTPFFRWQLVKPPFDTTAAKTEILVNWQEEATPVISRLLPGCGIELLMPEAYYTVCREADIKIRPVSIRAAVFYLSNVLSVDPSELSVIIAAFGNPDNNGQIDEYRVSFCVANAPEVVYGVIWPIYQQDDQLNAVEPEQGQLSQLSSALAESLLGEIPTVLAECGVLRVKKLEDVFAMEFCDDCGAPLFADADAELVHAEMPDDAPPQGSSHFH